MIPKTTISNTRIKAGLIKSDRLKIADIKRTYPGVPFGFSSFCDGLDTDNMCFEAYKRTETNGVLQPYNPSTDARVVGFLGGIPYERENPPALNKTQANEAIAFARKNNPNLEKVFFNAVNNYEFTGELNFPGTVNCHPISYSTIGLCGIFIGTLDGQKFIDELEPKLIGNPFPAPDDGGNGGGGGGGSFNLLAYPNYLYGAGILIGSILTIYFIHKTIDYFRCYPLSKCCTKNETQIKQLRIYATKDLNTLEKKVELMLRTQSSNHFDPHTNLRTRIGNYRNQIEVLGGGGGNAALLLNASGADATRFIDERLEAIDAMIASRQPALAAHDRV